MGSIPRLAAVTAPETAPGGEIHDELLELEDVSRDLETHTLSANTRRAYEKAWGSFTDFCDSYGLDALPAHPETVRWFVAWMSVQVDDQGRPRLALATIRQRLAGIAERHLRDGYLDPTGHRGVTGLVSGLSKLRAVRPERKRPLLLDDVARLVRGMDHQRYPAGVSAARDELALWLGFAGALRRSEAAALRLRDLELHADDGIHIHVGKSKADQDNTGPDVVVLPYGSSPGLCPVCAVHRWVRLLSFAEIGDERRRRQQMMRELFSYTAEVHVCGAENSTPLISGADLMSSAFLLRSTYRNRASCTIQPRGISGDALHTMLRVRLREIGVNPDRFGYHSLRAGHVTQARRNGATTEEIMRAGRWQKAETVNVYDREYNPATRNSVLRLGL